jgi:hypothetical protein
MPGPFSKRRPALPCSAPSTAAQSGGHATLEAGRLSSAALMAVKLEALLPSAQLGPMARESAGLGPLQHAAPSGTGPPRGAAAQTAALAAATTAAALEELLGPAPFAPLGGEPQAAAGGGTGAQVPWAWAGFDFRSASQQAPPRGPDGAMREGPSAVDCGLWTVDYTERPCAPSAGAAPR